MSKIIGDLKSAGNVGGSVNFTKGDKGERGDSGVYVGSGEMPADCNVQVDPDGEATVVLVGKTWTLDEASEAAVWNTGGAGNVVLNFGIPRGVKGDKGDRGSTPYIGENLHWWIDGVDTNVAAHGLQGDNGVTPHIGSDGDWHIGDQDTGVRATAIDGFSPIIGYDGNWVTANGNTGIPATGPQGPKGEPGKDAAVKEWQLIADYTLDAAALQAGVTPTERYTEVYIECAFKVETDETTAKSVLFGIGRGSNYIVRNTVSVKNGDIVRLRATGMISPSKKMVYYSTAAVARFADVASNCNDPTATQYESFFGEEIRFHTNSAAHKFGAGSTIKVWGR